MIVPGGGKLGLKGKDPLSSSTFLTKKKKGKKWENRGKEEEEGKRSHIEKTERKRLKEQGEKEKEVDGIEVQS